MKLTILLSILEHRCVPFVWPHELRYYAGNGLLERPALPGAAAREMMHTGGLLETWHIAYGDESDQRQLVPDDNVTADRKAG